MYSNEKEALRIQMGKELQNLWVQPFYYKIILNAIVMIISICVKDPYKKSLSYFEIIMNNGRDVVGSRTNCRENELQSKLKL